VCFLPGGDVGVWAKCRLLEAQSVTGCRQFFENQGVVRHFVSRHFATRLSIITLMEIETKFPVTNQELFEIAQGEAVRFPASRDEFWELLEEAEYRVDYFDHEIIASINYGSRQHSEISVSMNYLLHHNFGKSRRFKIHGSSRPLCIPGCDYAVFNPDGSVTTEPFEQYEYRPGMNAELCPVLLFEVLSLSTRARDFGEKLPCYKKIPSLRQVIFLEQHHMEAILFERLDSPNRWLETTLTQPDDTITVNGQPISLREIYG
jgi:Uma2 family endonuclease